jgi:hypothetical protein
MMHNKRIMVKNGEILITGKHNDMQTTLGPVINAQHEGSETL